MGGKQMKTEAWYYTGVTAALILGLIQTAVSQEPETAAAQQAEPAGQENTVQTKVLEAGAHVFQNSAPLQGFAIYLVGFHPMKDEPEHQMIAHHYCHQLNEDLAQCVLFDGNGAHANLTGVEYIISEPLFETLPEDERQYWHPHNGEILSGQLVAPYLPQAAENKLMQGKMNSYGKTWHVWASGTQDDQPSSLPLGPSRLAWSFNRDGEVNPDLIQQRDKALGVNTGQIRRARKSLQDLAHPQQGVDALKGQFGPQEKEIPAVMEKP